MIIKIDVNYYDLFSGKLLNVLVTGLSDRNRTIRRTYALCIGQLIGPAKDASVDKLIEKLRTVYLEKEGLLFSRMVIFLFLTVS